MISLINANSQNPLLKNVSEEYIAQCVQLIDNLS